MVCIAKTGKNTIALKLLTIFCFPVSSHRKLLTFQSLVIEKMINRHETAFKEVLCAHYAKKIEAKPSVKREENEKFTKHFPPVSTKPPLLGLILLRVMFRFLALDDFSNPRGHR